MIRPYHFAREGRKFIPSIERMKSGLAVPRFNLILPDHRKRDYRVPIDDSAYERWRQECVFVPPFGAPFRSAFASPAVAVPWWLSGGIAAANCIAAYQPKGAASLAASYDNRAAPGNGLADGTYDATVIAAGVSLAAGGWLTNGSGILSTGWTPPTNLARAVVVTYSGASAGIYTLFGCANAGLTRFFLIMPSYSSHVLYYNSNTVTGTGAGLLAGTAAMNGLRGYREGVLDTNSDFSYAVEVFAPCYIFATNKTGGTAQYLSPNGTTIKAISFYIDSLSAAQLIAVGAAQVAL